MGHLHSVYDTDLHFMIDPITRTIINQATAKTKLIQHDHNSERFTFEIPRFVESHDMSLCDKIEVHYINIAANKSDKSEDVYLVDDVQLSPADDNMVIFSWLISGNATKYAGTLNFLIRFVCVTGETIDYAWHTEIYNEITVSDGMNNSEAVIADNSDVLEAWKAEVLSEVAELVERAEAAAIRAEEVANGAGGGSGGAGENGATFIPDVSEDGVLSWINDKGLDNPDPVNIKGKNGTSVTVESVSMSSEDGGSNVVTFSDGKTLTVNNGNKGADGKSVTIKSQSASMYDGGENTVTFSDGTILSVMNGSKGSKGDKGEKGDKGDTGADGKDYVLTDADKDEIAERVGSLSGTNNTLPDYWENYLPDKIAAIKALQYEGGKDCFSFVFITDTHYPSNLGKCSPALAKKIVDECNIKFVLNGGDNQTRGCYQTKDEILLENKQLKEMFLPIKNKVLQVEGNHDGSYYWSGGTVGNGTAYVKQLTEQEMFEEYYRANGLNCDVHFDENSNAFYVDDVSNKVRYIGLNSMNVPNSKTDVDTNGIATYTKFTSYQFLQAQYDFLCNEALATVPNDTWSVVVFGHSGIYNAGDYAVMVDVLSAYKDKTNCIAEYAGTASGGAAYTNLAEPLPNNTTDNTKWVNGYRISSSAITASSGSGKTVCNPIPVEVGDVIRIKGVSFISGTDRVGLCHTDGTSVINFAYVSALPDSYMQYSLADDVHTFTILSTGGNSAVFRCAFDTPTDASTVIITKNEEIVEAEHGYDYVSVNHDFTNAKGKFVAYFHGHDHKDADYTRDSIKDISTRCDGVEEHTAELQAERVKGTITEQSFDVFTVNRKTKKIYATKIGAGIDREISY